MLYNAISKPMRPMHILLFVLFLSFPAFVTAQERTIAVDSTIITHHEVTVKGKHIAYTATTGTQPVWDKEDKVVAYLHYTYYKRDDTAQEAIGSRPLLISFNGGPGSASVWMHIAYTGPRLLEVDAEGFPIQPYGIKENPYTVLDVTDILYVNPVNTGYSRMIKGDHVKREFFFGVNADIDYLAEWLNTFVSRHGRWLSPKYLIGESYGTIRVSGLALALQNSEWMYLNGVILVSPTDLGIAREGIVKAANRLPYFSATAWYHKVLPSDLQNKTLEDLLSEVESFSIDTLMPALAKGNRLDKDKKEKIAATIARYSGLSKKFVRQNNLNVPVASFWKELLRDKGFTVGRLDSRYLGIDMRDAGDKPDYNAELTSWLHAFTPAINHYMRTALNYKVDIKYNMFGSVRPWDNNNNHTGENLRQAMAQNPYLHVMVQAGYFDGATNYFDSKYTLWQLDPGGKMKERMQWHGYESGHMMYLRKKDLIQANEDIRSFIQQSTPGEQPAKYR